MHYLRDDDWTVETLKQKLDQQDDLLLVDVREVDEFEFCKIEGSVLCPLMTIPARYLELPKDKDIVLICHHGVRSRQALNFLKQKGFEKVYNLFGGIHQWSLNIDQSVAVY